MTEDEKPSRTESTSTAKPEETGRPVPGKGEAVEPEATRALVDGAVKAGDRMWGPLGKPDDEP